MNLIKADLKKLLLDKPFKIILIIMAVFNIFTPLLFKFIDIVNGGTLLHPSENMEVFGVIALYSNIGASQLGLFMAVLISMFVGKDRSYNTIRNKIIGGNSRFKIYASALAVNLIIGIILFIISAAESLLLTLPFFGRLQSAGDIAASFFLTMILYIGFICVMTFVSMSVKSQALGIIINVLIMIVVPSLLSFVSMLTEVDVLSEGLRKSIKIILSVNPYHLINQLTAPLNSAMTGSGEFFQSYLNVTLTAKVIGSTLVLSLGACGLGYAIFYNSDIK